MRNNVSFVSLQAVLPKLRKFIETNRMEEEAMAYIEQIDQMGGMVAAIDKGFPQMEMR